jgi:hypothetical protein
MCKSAHCNIDEGFICYKCISQKVHFTVNKTPQKNVKINDFFTIFTKWWI